MAVIERWLRALVNIGAHRAVSTVPRLADTHVAPVGVRAGGVGVAVVEGWKGTLVDVGA